MTSQLLTRVPTELKKQFEQKVQADGVSMNFIVTTFIEEYVKKRAQGIFSWTLE